MAKLNLCIMVHVEDTFCTGSMLLLLLAACRNPDTGKPAHDLDSVAPCTASAWYADADGDGHGTAATAQDACDQPAGWVSSGDDCDDTLAGVYPGAVEVCNAIDDDCDGTVDDNPADGTTWNVDADGDGYGAPMLSCESAGVEVADTSDCDDTDADVYPGSTEVDGNGADDDCDGRVDEIRVCEDGTGDYDTIQGAVDAAPVDGAAVEVCPGTYYEAVTIGDRVIEIYGETGDPEDVVIDASGLGRAVYAYGASWDGTAAYVFEGLTFIGGGTGALAVYSSGSVELAHTIVRDTVVAYGSSVVSLMGSISMHDSEVRDNGDSTSTSMSVVILDAYEGSYMRRCSVQGNFGMALYAPDVAVSNNLFTGNVADGDLITQDLMGSGSASLFFNNTVVDNVVNAGPLILVTMYESWYSDDHNFRNNIFQSNTATDVILYNAAAWGSCTTCDQNGDGACSASEALAHCTTPVLGYNWFNESKAALCTSSWCTAVLTSGNQYAVDLGLSDSSDPPYTLPAGSPAIDGGDPAAEYLDADGTINDPGRYGGLNAYE